MTWQPASRSRVQIVDSNIPDYRGCAQVPSRHVALRARHECGTPRGSEESRRLLGTRFRLAYTDELSNTMPPQGMLASPCRLHGTPITCLVTFIVAPQIYSILEPDAMASIVHVLHPCVVRVTHSGVRIPVVPAVQASQYIFVFQGSSRRTPDLLFPRFTMAILDPIVGVALSPQHAFRSSMYSRHIVKAPWN